MKIRARKIQRNVEMDEHDILLDELSKDMETFVLDEELSCNECDEKASDDIDTFTSFVIKLKADNLNNPKVIYPVISGYVLPDDLPYQQDPLPDDQGFFRSVRQHHHIAKMDESQTRSLAKLLHSEPEREQVVEKAEMHDYFRTHYESDEWQNLLKNKKKKLWKKSVGKALKDTLIETYGNLIDDSVIKDALSIDKSSFKTMIAEVNAYNGFDEEEKSLLRKHQLIIKR